jgi:hypothetical protein
MSKSIIPEVVEAAQNRRSFVRKLGLATAAAGAIAVAGNKAEGATTTDVTVLNFALNLEYLESEFYTYATTGAGIEAQGIGVNGTANSPNPTTGGMTTGGSQVTFSNSLLFSSQLAQEIAADERAHVKLLRTALGANAIAKPNLNLSALGFGFASQNDFIKLARIFEDIGVSAYAGASSLLSSSVIQTAAQILAAEAEHVASLRLQCARLNIPTNPPLDGVDILPPPSGAQNTYLSINPSTGLCAVRTPGQVLYLAFGNKAGVTSGGFFPSGVNGTVTTSSASA